MFLQDSVCCRELEEPRFSFKRKDAGKNGFNPGLIFRSMNFKYGEQIVSKGDRNGWVGRILPGEGLQASLPSPPVDIGQEASSFPGKPGDSNLCFFCRAVAGSRRRRLGFPRGGSLPCQIPPGEG